VGLSFAHVVASLIGRCDVEDIELMGVRPWRIEHIKRGANLCAHSLA
jgi:hypothetical protein